MKLLSRYALAWMVVAVWISSNAAGAELAADKQQEIEALNESVSEAARLFKQGKVKDCADVVRRTQQACETMAAGGGAGIAAALQPVYERLSKAHALLELEGVSLPPLKKMDGSAESQDRAQVARLAKAQPATPDELTTARQETALKNWALGMPGIQAARAETEHFLLLGNVSEQTLQQNGELAESLLPKVGELFAAPADAPLMKGRVTLFLLEKRYDYTEFGTLVEKQAPPAEWAGHWTYNVADAYGVSIVPKSGEHSMDALLAQQLAGLHVASLGSAPRWFAEGVARAAAAKLKPDDVRVKAWDAQLPAAVASLKRPDDFQTGNASPEYGDLASYSFAKLLMTDARRFRTLLQGIRTGQDFAAACTAAYGGSPSQVAEIWYKRAAAAKSR